MNIHRYRKGSETVILVNDSEERVLDIATNQLQPCKGNMLFLHEALYALRVQHTFVPFSPDVSFFS